MKTVPKRITRRAWTGLVLLTLPMLMMATDMTMMFLVMPPLTADLTPSTTQTLWIMHVGEFAAACLVITMGWLTDRIGPRTLLLAAMALYGIASGQAAFAPTPETLLAARILIGVATAAVTPAGFTMLRSMFTNARHFGIAVAVMMGTFSVGGALGPPMGGMLLEHFWWGSVFLINVPVAALVLLTGFWVFPRVRGTKEGRIDMTSVVLSTASVILVVMAMQEIADQGPSIPHTLAGVVGLGLGVWFVRRQKNVDNPLLDLGLFAIRTLRITLMVFVLVALAFMAVDLVLVQYLQIVAGVPTGRLGLMFAVPGIAAIVGTVVTPILARRFAPAHLMATGLTVSLTGTLMIMGSIPWAPHLAWPLVAGTTLISFGIPPTTVLGAQLVVTSAPGGSSGSAVALQDIGAGLGAATGMALTGSIAMAVFGRGVEAGVPEGISDTELDTATQTPTGAVAVAQELGGDTGGALLVTALEAWSWGTVAAHAAVFVLGLMTLVVAIRGLRGAKMPDDDSDTDRPGDRVDH